MKKTKTLTVRVSEKTYNRLENIRKQLVEKGFNIEELNNSFIIREALSLLDEKAKYFIWENTFTNNKN